MIFLSKSILDSGGIIHTGIMTVAIASPIKEGVAISEFIRGVYRSPSTAGGQAQAPLLTLFGLTGLLAMTRCYGVFQQALK